MSKVELEISEYGRPIVWIASYYYKCLPGSAVEYITSNCTFSTRAEAIRWCKFELQLQGGIQWKDWKSSSDDYPYMKNCDDPRFDPSFTATIEGETERADGGGMGKWSMEVKVRKAEVCGEFDWYAKPTHGDWDQANTTSEGGVRAEAVGSQKG